MSWKIPIIDELKFILCLIVTTSYQIVFDIIDTRQKVITFTQFKSKSIFSEDLINTREIMK